MTPLQFERKLTSLSNQLAKLTDKQQLVQQQKKEFKATYGGGLSKLSNSQLNKKLSLNTNMTNLTEKVNALKYNIKALKLLRKNGGGLERPSSAQLPERQKTTVAPRPASAVQRQPPAPQAENEAATPAAAAATLTENEAAAAATRIQRIQRGRQTVKNLSHKEEDIRKYKATCEILCTKEKCKVQEPETCIQSESFLSNDMININQKMAYGKAELHQTDFEKLKKAAMSATERMEKRRN